MTCALAAQLLKEAFFLEKKLLLSLLVFFFLHEEYAKLRYVKNKSENTAMYCNTVSSGRGLFCENTPKRTTSHPQRLFLPTCRGAQIWHRTLRYSDLGTVFEKYRTAPTQELQFQIAPFREGTVGTV